MTREKAIEYLKKADVTVYQEPKTKTAEALEMAIKALEQEPVLDKIRAEIETESAKSFGYPNWERAKALKWALSIIDKYKAESDKGAEK